MLDLTPADVIAALMRVAPCPVIHSTLELPKDDRAYGKARRSRYMAKRSGRWARAQDYILVNEGDARHWLYVDVLAHEIGHALDFHGRHPCQQMLHSPRSRYRVELAAVSYEIAVCRQLGLTRMKNVRRWLQQSTEYLEGYKRGNHPRLRDIMSAMPTLGLMDEIVAIPGAS